MCLALEHFTRIQKNIQEHNETLALGQGAELLQICTVPEKVNILFEPFYSVSAIDHTGSSFCSRGDNTHTPNVSSGIYDYCS